MTFLNRERPDSLFHREHDEKPRISGVPHFQRNHLNGIMKWAILQIDKCPKPSVSLPGLHPEHVKVNPNRWFPFQELPRCGLKSGFLIEQTHSHHFLLKLNQVPIDRDHLKCFCHQQMSFRKHFQQTILFVISNWQIGWGFNHTIS